MNRAGTQVFNVSILEPHYSGGLNDWLMLLRRGVIEVADGGTGNLDFDKGNTWKFTLSPAIKYQDTFMDLWSSKAPLLLGVTKFLCLVFTKGPRVKKNNRCQMSFNLKVIRLKPSRGLLEHVWHVHNVAFLRLELKQSSIKQKIFHSRLKGFGHVSLQSSLSFLFSNPLFDKEFESHPFCQCSLFKQLVPMDC